MALATVIPIKSNPKIVDNIVELTLIDGKSSKKTEVRYNKDGSIDKRKPNSIKGKSTEVYPFDTKEEIALMVKYFDEKIENALDDNKRQIACRNKMLFIVGINIGIRASDIRWLQWDFFLNEDREFKDFYTLQPKKTKRTGKFVKLYFNNATKKAIMDYINEYPVENIEDYLFQSRKGDKPIDEKSLWRIIKTAAKDIGIKKNIGSHSLRKTFGFWCWHNAEDKNKTLVVLQSAFNHSSTLDTMKYIGLLDGEIEEMFNSIDLGLEFM